MVRQTERVRILGLRPDLWVGPRPFGAGLTKPHPLTGAARDAIFMSSEDAASLGVDEGDAVNVRSETGEVRARVHIMAIRPRNVQMFFPEANALIAAGRRDPIGLVPDYNAVVTITRV
ncbi:MAG: hypothetical protein E6J52_11390 [Chloroflexi bacterium]|nr:MAG: hypothetical protein E6J52_11390 [Chloroflexota bacterium]